MRTRSAPPTSSSTSRPRAPAPGSASCPASWPTATRIWCGCCPRTSPSGCRTGWCCGRTRCASPPSPRWPRRCAAARPPSRTPCWATGRWSTGTEARRGALRRNWASAKGTPGGSAQQVDWRPRGPSGNVLNRAGVEDPKLLFGHVAQVRGGDDAGGMQQGVIRREGLNVEDVQGGQARCTGVERCDQGLLIHDGAARGVDQDRAGLHQCQLSGRRRALARALTKVSGGWRAPRCGQRARRWSHQLGTDLGRMCGRQVLAVGDDVASRRPGQPARPGYPSLPRPLDPQRPSGQAGTQGLLPRLVHATRSGGGNHLHVQAAGRGKDRARCVPRAAAAAGGPGYGDAQLARRVQVDRGVAHARGDQELQVRQLAEPARGAKWRALAHRHDHLQTPAER